MNNKIFDVDKYFAGLDSNKDGFIDQAELCTALQSHGIPCCPALIKSIISKMDDNSDGKISIDEFKAYSEH